MSNEHKRTRTGQFAKGTSGNPSGRPPGSRNQATIAMEALLEGEAENLTRKVIELALGGNLSALRLCLERLSPPRKDRPVDLDLPPIQTVEQISGAMSTVVSAIGTGQITPGEGESLANMLALQTKVLESVAFESRLQILEQTAAEEDAPIPCQPKTSLPASSD